MRLPCKRKVGVEAVYPTDYQQFFARSRLDVKSFDPDYKQAGTNP